VGTFPQELSSLQLTGEPVVVQRKKKPSGARRKRQKKQEKANAAPRPTEDRKLEAPTVANRVLELMLILEIAVASSRTKRPLSPGGTPQDAQSQVKRTKQKQKETPYNS